MGYYPPKITENEVYKYIFEEADNSDINYYYGFHDDEQLEEYLNSCDYDRMSITIKWDYIKCFGVYSDDMLTYEETMQGTYDFDDVEPEIIPLTLNTTKEYGYDIVISPFQHTTITAGRDGVTIHGYNVEVDYGVYHEATIILDNADGKEEMSLSDLENFLKNHIEDFKTVEASEYEEEKEYCLMSIYYELNKDYRNNRKEMKLRIEKDNKAGYLTEDKDYIYYDDGERKLKLCKNSLELEAV